MKRRIKERVEEKKENSGQLKTLNHKLSEYETREAEALQENEGIVHRSKIESAICKEMVKNISQENQKLKMEKEEAEKGKFTLQKRLAAAKKHLKGSKRKLEEMMEEKEKEAQASEDEGSDAQSSEDEENEVKIQENEGGGQSSKICYTKIKGVRGPLIEILSKTSVDFISVGKTHVGNVGSKSDTSEARGKKYFAFQSVETDCSRQEMWRRAKDGRTLLNFVAAAEDHQSDERLTDLMTKMMWLKPHVFALSS